MGNGVSIDQGNLPSCGIRDVSDAADRKQYDWSQLAEVPVTEQPSYTLSSPRNPYNGARTRGRESSTFSSMDGLLNSTEDVHIVGANVRFIPEVQNPYIVAHSVGLKSSTEDKSSSSTEDTRSGTYIGAQLRDTESEDDTQLDIFCDALSSVMKDDSGYNTRISTWESAESANTNQFWQRRRQSASGSAEDGEVRAEVNRRRERRKKSTTSTETALPKSTNTHADASACTAAQYAEDKKSTYTCDDASARPVSGCAAACHTEERISTRQLKSTYTYDDASARPVSGRVAAHHAEERTAMKRPTSLQLVPTRDISLPTDKVLPPSTPRSPESSTMGFHAQELTELQQRPEAMEDQPRRVSAEVRRELDEIRRLGRLVKDLDEATILESDTGSGFGLTRHVELVKPLTDATFEQPEAQSYCRQGYAYGVYPEETGLYGRLRDADSTNIGGLQRQETYPYDQRDSASGAFEQQPLCDVQKREVDKVLLEQTSEGIAEPEIADMVYRAVRTENDDASRMEGSTIEAELRATPTYS